jgi:hypothetical protein
MADEIRFQRGPEYRLPLLDNGEPAITTDTGRLFFGTPQGNVQLALKTELDTATNGLPGLTNRVTNVEKELEYRGINPETFGLDESATDNTQAMIDTFNFISVMQNGKGRIVFPAGKTFKFTQSLGSYNLSTIHIDLQGSTLDFSTLPTNVAYTFLSFAGTYGSTSVLTSDGVEGSKVIQTNTSGFAVGDMVRIYSNEIWDSQRTSSRYGEIGFVESIDSAVQLTLTTELNATYKTSFSATIQKLNPIRNIVIENGTILGAPSSDEHIGIEIKLGLDCVVSNMRFKGIGKRNIYLTDCLRSNVVNSHFEATRHATQAYGVSFTDATQDCTVYGCHFTDVRHSMTTNNNPSSSWGIARRIRFINNTVNDTADDLIGGVGDAIDTHAGCEDVLIMGNTVYSTNGNAINIEGRRAVIQNNIIRIKGNAGIYLRPYVDKPSSFIITGNDIRCGDDTGSADYGIRVYANIADVERIVIANNNVESAITPISVQGSPFRINQAAITSNIVKTTRSGAPINVSHIDNGTISGNTIYAISSGLLISESSLLAITGNSIRSVVTSGTPSGINLGNNTSGCSVTGNVMIVTGTFSSATGILLNTSATYNAVTGNVTQGYTTVITLSTGVGNIQANNI